MSATITCRQFAEYFATPIWGKMTPAYIFEVEGKPYAIEEFYLEDIQHLLPCRVKEEVVVYWWWLFSLLWGQTVKTVSRCFSPGGVAQSRWPSYLRGDVQSGHQPHSELWRDGGQRLQVKHGGAALTQTRCCLLCSVTVKTGKVLGTSDSHRLCNIQKTSESTLCLESCNCVLDGKLRTKVARLWRTEAVCWFSFLVFMR